MPAGKLGAIAGRPVWTGPLHYGVSVRSMRLHQSSKTPKPRHDVTAIKKCRKTLRQAFKRYRIDAAQAHPTATELRESLHRIRTAARRYASEGDLHWADKLLERLETDKNAEKIVRQSLWTADLDWLGFKGELRAVYAVHATPARSMEVAKRIAEIDIEELAPDSGPWRDPALFRLVYVLTPLWEEVTGRTAAQSTVDRIQELKEFRFAEWLEEMLALIGRPRPLHGAVLDIVLHQKKENPASVKS